MTQTSTITATELKAKCLDILDRLASHELEEVIVTKRGKVVAVLTPPPSPVGYNGGIYGCLKGSTWLEPGLDLTEPILPFSDDDADEPT